MTNFQITNIFLINQTKLEGFWSHFMLPPHKVRAPPIFRNTLFYSNSDWSISFQAGCLNTANCSHLPGRTGPWRSRWAILFYCHKNQTGKHPEFFSYRIVASSSPSRIEAHAGLFRLLMKEIFDPYVLWTFDKKLIF